MTVQSGFCRTWSETPKTGFLTSRLKLKFKTCLGKPQASLHGALVWKGFSCTPDRNCHTFCLGDKIASHPGVLTQAKKNTQNLEINQILGVVVQEKESNMVFCSRWKFPTLGMTVLSGTSAEPRFRSARSSLGLETSI